jgi:putative transposase
MFDPESAARPDRKHPIHQPVIESGNRAVIVFVTVCAKNRAPVLATSAMHQSLLSAWSAAGHWLIGHYVILPDHIHLFCAPGVYPVRPLLNWVQYWKSLVAKSTAAGADSLWEKNFWDTQLRRSDSYSTKRVYVRNNPVRHGLVSQSEDWPYQGELNLLRWHD